MISENELLNAVKLDACSISYDDDIWSESTEKCKFVPVPYCRGTLRFNKEYYSQNGAVISNLSKIIMSRGKPVAIWPLSMSASGGEKKLTTVGGAVLPPLFFSSVSLVEEKNIIRKCFKFANLVCKKNDIKCWSSFQQFNPNFSNKISLWCEEALNSGAAVELKHAMYVDLSLDMEQYQRHLRKSYRSLIKFGREIWSLKVVCGTEHCDLDLWHDFHRLHAKVAGRETRSSQTWERLYCSIKDKHALLICLLDSNGKLVGGGYFTFSRQEVVYSIAAYDRSMFDKPLGHVVQARLIEEMMCSTKGWYRLGQMSHKNENSFPTDKELAITKFKSGFATNVVPEYCFDHIVE